MVIIKLNAVITVLLENQLQGNPFAVAPNLPTPHLKKTAVRITPPEAIVINAKCGKMENTLTQVLSLLQALKRVATIGGLLLSVLILH